MDGGKGFSEPLGMTTVLALPAPPKFLNRTKFAQVNSSIESVPIKLLTRLDLKSFTGIFEMTA
jgi:hypothetical protein